MPTQAGYQPWAAKGLMILFTRIIVLFILALGVLVPLIGAPAQADPIGGVIVIPGSGSDLTGIRVRTSAGCPTQANAYYATVKGRGFPPEGQVVTSNTKASLSHSFGFDAYFLLIMRDYASRNNTTLGGRYDITVFCIDSFTLHDYGEFTGSMEFTSPTHYEALGAAKPIGPPPPPLEQAPDGSALPPRSALPPNGRPAGIGDQPRVATVQTHTASPPTSAPLGSRPPISTVEGMPAPASTGRLPSAGALEVRPPVGSVDSERYDASAHGIPWLIVFGAVLGGGAMIVLAKWIRTRSSR